MAAALVMVKQELEEVDQQEEELPVWDENMKYASDSTDSTQNVWVMAKAAGSSFSDFCSSAATGDLPSTESWPGELDFEVKFSDVTDKHSWLFSERLDKLFTDTCSCIPARVHMNWKKYPQPQKLLVRLQAIFVGENVAQVVRRCPVHAKPRYNDKTMEEEPPEQREQLIQMEHRDASYHRDPSSGRLSVTLPLQPPQPGTDYTHVYFRFMCLGSCVGGICRRRLRLVFTLEDPKEKLLLGRRSFALRVCACPRRDKNKEETTATNRPEISSKPESSPNRKRKEGGEVELDAKKKVDMEAKVMWNVKELGMLPVPWQHYNDVAEYVRLKIKSEACTNDQKEVINRLEVWENLRVKMQENCKKMQENFKR